MKYLNILVLAFISLFFSNGLAFSLPAFPNAQGMGAESIGGRGGTVYIVDTLSDNPSDGLTFREACEASGPRIVVFKVSGIINLDSVLYINNPYITIAGQTSPGGILIAKQPTRILTHDVIITNMRFRKGSHGCSDETCETLGESLFIGNGYNIIIDHCSLSWGTDEVLQIGSYWGDVYDVTISWCSIVEGLQDPHPESNHGYGVLISSKFFKAEAPKVTLHHNFIAHMYDRSPQLVGPVLVDMTNNVVYDFKGSLVSRAIYYDNDLPSINFVHNYIKPGINSNAAFPEGTAGELMLCGDGSQASIVEAPSQKIYMVGNLGMIRNDQNDDEWAAVSGWSGNLAPKEWQRVIKNPVTGIPVFATTMDEAYAIKVVEGAGATSPVRDSIDVVAISNFKNGTGTFRSNANYPDDFPLFSNPSPPVDSDHDGIADEWEANNGMDNTKNDSALDNDGDGYTNIEEYLFYLADYTHSNTDMLYDSGTANTPPAPPSNVKIP